MPDVASVPRYAMATGARNQPFPSARRANAGAMTVGGVLSILSQSSIVDREPSVARAVQYWYAAFESAVSMMSPQPVFTAVDGRTVQASDTLERNHPLQSKGAGEQS